MDLRKLLFPGVIGFAIYFGLAEGEYSVLDVRRAEAEVQAKEAQLPLIRRAIDSLEARIDSLQNDDLALERFARERYGFIRDGEYLYRLSGQDTDSVAPLEEPRP